jgi:hypothetical protein
MHRTPDNLTAAELLGIPMGRLPDTGHLTFAEAAPIIAQAACDYLNRIGTRAPRTIICEPSPAALAWAMAGRTLPAEDPDDCTYCGGDGGSGVVVCGHCAEDACQTCGTTDDLHRHGADVRCHPCRLDDDLRAAGIIA